MNASATKTDRSGVLAAIHRAAVSCASPTATMFERTCQTAMSAGDSALTTRMAAISGFGQRRISQRGEDRDRDPHDLEVLVHVEFDRAHHDDVGNDEQRHHPGDEEPSIWHGPRRERGHDREDERDPEVGQVEEGDGRRPVAEAPLAPAGDEPERPDLALEQDRRGDERGGQDDRRQEQHRIAGDRPGAPCTGRHDVQEDDEVGRREGEELERREERGQDPGQQDPERAAIRGS